MNSKQIQVLCDRISFSLLYEDYESCDGEQILLLIEEAREMLSRLAICDQKV